MTAPGRSLALGHRGPALKTAEGTTGRIVLVGSPNVGKSVMFHNLTGVYVTVSNYPGTTVEMSRGMGAIGHRRYEVVDTPGMYSLLSISEDERVARSILLDEAPDLVLHIVDARNLDRMLLLTFQLIEAGLRVILVVNMMDEARAAGLHLDADRLEDELGIPVVGTVSTTGEGMERLRRRIARPGPLPAVDRFRYRALYGLPVEQYLGRLEELLMGAYPLSRRCIALLLLQGDEEIHRMVRLAEGPRYEEVHQVTEEARRLATMPVDYILTMIRREWAARVHATAVRQVPAEGEPFSEKLSRLMLHPLTGFPILFLVLYLGLYKLVGQFGAGTVVDFLEGTVFEGWLNPLMTRAAERVIPWAVVRDLFVGEYGVLTLGLRYGVAIILPIVTFFFLIFSFIEDVGYLPRLALLLDRMFKKLGLSGRAVIPMVLGLGCDTMATMVTRTLSTKREQLIAVLLLSLSVPCSAQLGVLMGLLSRRPLALAVWAVVILGVYVGVGSLAARVIPGRRAPFYVEVSPLRWPKLANIARKTFARVKWYLKEVIPLFMLASVLIWMGRLTGLFDLAIRALAYPVRWVGLPAETARVFLFGFFRRDYGMAGLYDLAKEGALSGRQIVVATVALTLFLPCIAHFLITVKEKGWKIGLGILATVGLVAFSVAFMLAHLLDALGVAL